MNRKLKPKAMFTPIIKWLDEFYDTVEKTVLFNEDDELVEEFGVVSNNFDIRELHEEESDDDLPDFIKNSMGENQEVIKIDHEEFLEMIGYTPEEIEEDRRTVQLVDYDVFFSTEKEKNAILLSLRSVLEGLIKTFNMKVSHLINNENLLDKARDTEHIVVGGTISLINDGEQIIKKYSFQEEE